MKVSLLSSGVLPVPPPRYGGAEVIVGLIARELAALGHEVTLFALAGSRPIPGVRLVEFADVREPLVKYADMLLDCDIVHGHVPAGVTWEFAAAHPGLARPRILHTVHGVSLDVLPPAGVIVAGVSASQAFALSGELGHTCPWVYNGIDLDAYPLHEGPRDGPLLYMNRIAPEKGLHLAMEVCRRLGERLQVCGTEHLVGSPPYVRAMLARMDGDQVIYHGDVGMDVKVPLLQHARALLWTAPWEEPFGMGVVEAMACGTPVIGLARGALPELLQGGGVPVGSFGSEYLRGFVDVALQIPPRRCRDNAEKFSARSMGQGYELLYREVIDGRWDGESGGRVTVDAPGKEQYV